VSFFNLVWMIHAAVTHGWRLDESPYPTTSFFLALAVGCLALFLYLRARPARRSTPRWFAPAAFSFAAIHTGAILLSTLFPHMPDALMTAAGLIGRHWTIPWSILIAVSLAQTHYADVVLKRSLWLLVSITAATLVGLYVIGTLPALALLATILSIAALMLAAPFLIRILESIVDESILARPDFAHASRQLDRALRRAAGPEEAVYAALDTLKTTLHVDADWDESSRQFEVNVTHDARTLMQRELAFVDSVRMQVEHRLDALHFDAEQRALLLREERLKRLLTEAELKALRTQVDPHFLFNTLNTIADLIGTNPPQAERMTERLAECFRYALAKHSRDLSTLDEELDFARQYLEIEQVRFGERLRVQLSRGDASGAEAVPSLLLQPLLENAIRHGLAPKREGGCVSVHAHRDGETLRLDIEDDGVGMHTGAGTGVGLRNVQDRLRTLYAQAAKFLIGDRPDGRGTRITIVIPLHAH
jgi:signal transduction histidine kinase